MTFEDVDKKLLTYFFSIQIIESHSVPSSIRLRSADVDGAKCCPTTCDKDVLEGIVGNRFVFNPFLAVEG